MAVWYTADLHFGHARIIELCGRPFESVDHMDAELIRRWNARVKARDLVYVVGDFAWHSHTPYLAQLNGDKHLIYGNHDPKRIKRSANDEDRPAPDGWLTVSGIKEIMAQDGKLSHPVVLCHYALRVWNRSHHGALHFYGHSHGNLPGDSQSCDVGVDCWDYQPVSLAEIKARLATLPQRGEPDHHRLPPTT